VLAMVAAAAVPRCPSTPLGGALYQFCISCVSGCIVSVLVVYSLLALVGGHSLDVCPAAAARCRPWG
jgi:hypothetical protein